MMKPVHLPRRRPVRVVRPVFLARTGAAGPPGMLGFPPSSPPGPVLLAARVSQPEALAYMDVNARAQFPVEAEVYGGLRAVGAPEATDLWNWWDRPLKPESHFTTTPLTPVPAGYPKTTLDWLFSALSQLGFRPTADGLGIARVVAALQRAGYLRANGVKMAPNGSLGVDTIQAIRHRLKERGIDIPFPWESTQLNTWALVDLNALPASERNKFVHPGSESDGKSEWLKPKWGRVNVRSVSPAGIRGPVDSVLRNELSYSWSKDSSVDAVVDIPANAVLGVESLTVSAPDFPGAGGSFGGTLSPIPVTGRWASNLTPDTAHTGQVYEPAPPARDTWSMLASGLGLAGTALGAYHGYKRTGSVGWAVGWALLGGLFPIITIPVAYAQGFGKPEPSFRGTRK